MLFKWIYRISLYIQDVQNIFVVYRFFSLILCFKCCDEFLLQFSTNFLASLRRWCVVPYITIKLQNWSRQHTVYIVTHRQLTSNPFIMSTLADNSCLGCTQLSPKTKANDLSCRKVMVFGNSWDATVTGDCCTLSLTLLFFYNMLLQLTINRLQKTNVAVT